MEMFKKSSTKIELLMKVKFETLAQNSNLSRRDFIFYHFSFLSSCLLAKMDVLYVLCVLLIVF